MLGVTHAIGCSSGTDALLAALMALDLRPGDEVLCPSFTFFATGGCVWRLGARPVFVDVSPRSWSSEREHFEARITERTRAILPVHLFGRLTAMDPILDLARSHGVPVIEDVAQALGAEAGSRQAGAFGALGCFSFFPTKNLGAFGDAGMCVTNDSALHERMRILRVHGGEPKYYHSVIGGNFRLDELQAAVLVIKLKHLDDWTRARQANAAHYDELFRDADLGNAVRLPARIPGSRHIFNQYVVRVSRRDELRSHLAANGVGTEIYYPVPLHAQRCFAYLEHDAGDFPHSLQAAADVLALPIYPELTAEQRQHVVRQIAAFVRPARR
jgi:dTDP-4-amino-4,6-dideoxygalactose transaminase